MIYAIGDIHGQIDMLHTALDLIAADGGADAQVIFVGDYTDRGPNSKAVIDTLIKGQSEGRNWTCLKGNHDRMFHDFVTKGVEHDPMVKSNISWVNKRLGGVTTLASYAVTGDPHFTHHDGDLERLTHYSKDGETLTRDDVLAQAKSLVPQAHLNFLDALPLIHETDDHIFVHAGLRPHVPLADQDAEDMLWIRDGFLETGYNFGKLVVHGHTALDHPTLYETRLNIDGGAGYGRPLVPIALNGTSCWTLTANGRQPLTLA